MYSYQVYLQDKIYQSIYPNILALGLEVSYNSTDSESNWSTPMRKGRLFYRKEWRKK
jgi:hypothetical protein